MKRNAGFTLIELIIVIVILGILAVVAAPKFINMQSDARASVVQGMKGSISAASQMVHGKAILKGYEKTASGVSITLDDGNTVGLAYGYPDASATGIYNALNVNGGTDSTSTTIDWVYGTNSTGNGSNAVSSFVMWPKSASYTSASAAVTGGCYVGYAAATATTTSGTTTITPPTVTIVTTGC